MESVACFLRNLIFIITLFICIVVEMKALIWMARKLCAYVQYIQRVSEVFDANTAALQRLEPAVIPGIKDGITSENDESHQVKTTGQSKKSKKPFKEKEEIVANESANRGRLPVCTSLLRMKQSGAEGRDSSICSFRRRDMVTPKLRPSLWPENSTVKNKRGTWGIQERNSGRILNCFGMASRPANDSFGKTCKASPIWNSTRRPWSLYQSGGKNQEGNTFSQVRDNGMVSKQIRMESPPDEEVIIIRDDRFPKTEKSTAAPSPTPCPVRLWSVDTDWKTTKEEPSAGNDVICASKTENSELNSGTENAKTSPGATTNEIRLRSNKMIFMVTVAVCCVVIYVAQPFCAYVDRKWDLFTNAVKHTDRELIALWLRILWSKACVLYQGTIRSAIRTTYDSITIAFAAVRSEMAGIALRIHSVLVWPQPEASQELRSWFSGKDQERAENTREKQEMNICSHVRSNSKACDRVSTTVKTTPDVRSAPFPVHLWSVDINEERVKKHSSNSYDICSSRTVNSDINPMMSLRKEKLQHDSSTRRRKEQSKSSPNAVDHTLVSVPCEEGEVKLSTKRKVKMKVSFKFDEPVKTPLVEEKQEKAKTPAQADLSARTTCETKEKVMPRLIPPSEVNAVVRAKARVQGKSSPQVGISTLRMPVKTRDESEVSGSHTSDKRSSAVEQDVLEDTGRRAKRRHIEQELTYSDKQDSINLTSQCGINAAVPSTTLGGSTTRPRASMKRKADDNPTEPEKYEPTFLHSVVQTGQVAAQMSQKAAESLEDPDADVEMREMKQEQVSSLNPFSFALPSFLTAPFTSQPDNEMDIDPEQFSTWKVFSFVPPSFLTAPFTSQPDDEMDIDPEQFSTWKVFSFVLPSFLITPFTSQPDNEMDIDPEQFSTWKVLYFVPPSFLSAPFTSEPTDEMDIDPEPFSTRKVFSLSLPSLLKMPSTSQPPEEEMEVVELPILVTPSNAQPKAMAINQPAVDTTPSKQPVYAKGPAEAAGIGRPEGEAPCLLPQQETAQVSHQQFDGRRQPASPFGVMMDTKRPLASTVGLLKEAAVPRKTPFAKQEIRQPAVKKPEIQQLVADAVKRQDNKPIFRPFAHLAIDALIHSQLSSAVESCSNNSNSEGQPGIGEISTAENTSETSEEKEQDAVPKSVSQFTMEQFQLEPPADDPASYFIQWHSVSDSDSDSDCGAQYELSELLDPETIEKHSAVDDVLEISPEQAERIAKSLAEKETRDWHNVSGSDFDDESNDDIDLIEHLGSETITQFPDLEDVLENSPQDITFMLKLLEEKKSSGLHCNM